MRLGPRRVRPLPWATRRPETAPDYHWNTPRGRGLNFRPADSHCYRAQCQAVSGPELPAGLHMIPRRELVLPVVGCLIRWAGVVVGADFWLAMNATMSASTYLARARMRLVPDDLE